MAIKRTDYSTIAVEAARSVLLELTHLLSEYRDDIVVIGGWVPELLLPPTKERHTGSIDVDLALDHRKLQEAGYKMIQQVLVERGYEQDEHQPFIFYRRVDKVTVEVDLLAGEYEGTGRSRRTQRVQDVRPRKARGCDLVFDNPIEIMIEGSLPDA
ncbi:MAG: hypothetical protein ACYTA5_24495 [Planctomycetota bacterium]|jgi:hypothetical protein